MYEVWLKLSFCLEIVNVGLALSNTYSQLELALLLALTHIPSSVPILCC